MRRHNHLGLVLLGLLWERPMHSYEMVASLRERGPSSGITVKHSSVYSTVDRLLRQGLIAVDRADRQGNRPERTVYSLTITGRAELQAWLAEMLEEPAEELPQFDAALTLVGLVEPGRAAELLAERANSLHQSASELDAMIARLREDGLPHLAVLELHYRVAMLRAQASWVEEFAADIQEGKVDGLADWTEGHRSGGSRSEETV